MFKPRTRLIAGLRSPLPLLLQQVGEVIALVHEVGVFAFLVVQLHDGPPVTLLGQQQLLQHPSVRLPLFDLQTVQLPESIVSNSSHEHPEAFAMVTVMVRLWGHSERGGTLSSQL